MSMIKSDKSSQVTIVVGAQWGDEGKGKWIDVLTPEQDIVLRYQGGDNAGHTLYVDGQKYVFHHLPSSILRAETVSGLLSGTVINPLSLVSELNQLPSRVQLSEQKLWISARAHVITPWHMVKDQQEESKASIALGTTLRGIGPAYTDKVARQGLIMSHYINRQKRSRWLERYKLYDSGFAEFLSSHQDVMSEFFATHHLVEPYVCHLESRLRLRLGEGAKVLCEGAQGTLLDVSHGTYPFVTSSHTIASGAFVSMGVSPNQSTRIIGIAKAYVTRVGEGPFPSELMGSDGQKLARLGNEFGATTGRPRRCGWLDAVALRYACEVNGFHEIFLNKVDILSGFDEIKLCSGYEHEKLGRLEYFPEDVTEYPYLTPVYEVFPSWHLDDLKSQKSSLPKELERFLSRIEEICGVPVTRVGTGPGRDDYLLVK